jgi:hypothetical protein
MCWRRIGVNARSNSKSERRTALSHADRIGIGIVPNPRRFILSRTTRLRGQFFLSLSSSHQTTLRCAPPHKKMWTSCTHVSMRSRFAGPTRDACDAMCVAVRRKDTLRRNDDVQGWTFSAIYLTVFYFSRRISKLIYYS